LATPMFGCLLNTKWWANCLCSLEPRWNIKRTNRASA